MTGRERLKMLRDFLAAHRETLNFDLTNWVRERKGEEKIKLPVPGDGVVEVNCGTVCCAVGWAMQIPALQDEGLRSDIGPWMADAGPWMGAIRYNAPMIDGSVSFEAVAEFFDLELPDVDWLFVREQYPFRYTINDVIERMGEYVD